MKKCFILGLFCAGIALLSGCATIIDGSTTEVTITTNAPDADIRVLNSVNGSVVNSGQSPMTVELSNHKKIFQPSVYQLEVIDRNKKKQTRVMQATFNPWFFGNFVLGGIIGMVVDAISGAVYEFDTEYYVHFSEYESIEKK